MLPKTLFLIGLVLGCGVSWANYQTDESAPKSSSHQQTKFFQLKDPGQKSTPVTFCLNPEGQLVVALAGVKPKLLPEGAEGGNAIREGVFNPGLIQIYRADGELLLGFPIDFRPETLASDSKGNLYVGGPMAICKFSPAGELLNRSLPPNLLTLTPEERVAIAEENLAAIAAQSSETTRRQLQLVEQVLRSREESDENQLPETGKLQTAGNRFAAMETGDLLRMREVLMRGLEESGENDPLTEERIQEALSRLGRVKSIASIGDEIFVAVQALSGEKGVEVWRFSSDLQRPVRIIERLAPAFIELEIQSDGEHLFIPEGDRRQLAVYSRIGEPIRKITLPNSTESLLGERTRISIQNVRLTAQGELLIYVEPSHSIHRLSPSGELVGEVGRVEGARTGLSAPFAFDEKQSRYYLLEQATATIRVLEPGKRGTELQAAPGTKPVEEWAKRLAGEWVMIAEEEARSVIDPEGTCKRIAFGPEGKLSLKLPTAEDLQEFGTFHLIEEQGNQLTFVIKQDQAELFRWTVKFTEDQRQFRLGISYLDPKPIWLGTFSRQAK